MAQSVRLLSDDLKVRALQELHELGFIHCDVKPNNFVLARDFHINDLQTN